MSPRILRLVPVLAAIGLLPLSAAAQSQLVAMTTHVPRDAAIAAVTAHAGETRDLCAPGEELRRDARGWVCEARVRVGAWGETETYQTFELASAGAAGEAKRFATACLAPEDRVVGGSCVRRDAAGYTTVAARRASAGGADAIECVLDGPHAVVAVGIAICLDVPPLR